MRVEKVVESLCRKYRTRNPFELSKCVEIRVSFLPLGGIRGYYSQCFKQKFIHINCECSAEDQRYTCAHELGHGILHPDSNTPFLRTKTLYPIGKYEKEANQFAVDLLYSDEDLMELLNYSIPEIAVFLNISENLAAYRLSVMKKKPAWAE